ncbi:hypothetical protein BHE74_00028278 [Ensete ventricosum]|nr:hypothetical protein GW17_00015668 [Ensete ventricosum]RWW64485.1 hypothetical protein BHE74_00028278 [Ensete ventricosum]
MVWLRTVCYRYADRPLPSGTAKNWLSAIDFSRRRPIEGEIDHRRPIKGEIDHRRLISIVGGQFRSSAVDFDRRQSIEGEKGKKKKKRKRRKKKNLLSTRHPHPHASRPCVISALSRGHFFSHARR